MLLGSDQSQLHCRVVKAKRLNCSYACEMVLSNLAGLYGSLCKRRCCYMSTLMPFGTSRAPMKSASLANGAVGVLPVNSFPLSQMT